MNMISFAGCDVSCKASGSACRKAQLSRQGKEVEEQRRRLPLPQYPGNPAAILRSVAALHPEV